MEVAVLLGASRLFGSALRVRVGVVISVTILIASTGSLDKNLDILAGIINAVPDAALALCDNSAVTTLYSRLSSMLVAASVLSLELTGRGRPDNLVLLSTYHAPAVIR